MIFFPERNLERFRDSRTFLKKSLYMFLCNFQYSKYDWVKALDLFEAFLVPGTGFAETSGIRTRFVGPPRDLPRETRVHACHGTVRSRHTPIRAWCKLIEDFVEFDLFVKIRIEVRNFRQLPSFNLGKLCVINYVHNVLQSSTYY